MIKGLKALEKLENTIPNGILFYEPELEIIEKELKNLEIIFRECIFNFEIVELNNLIYVVKIVDDINKFVFIVEKEEFNLLKEVFENERK